MHVQARALTRELGALKEDLQREQKRRARAVLQAQEAEGLRLQSEGRVKQLQYSNK